MNLPDFPNFSAELLGALLDKYGLTGYPIHHLPDTGIFNATF
jgi:hypothetical protein